jgi:hypothetical protein
MANIEILDSEEFRSSGGEPFTVSIVDVPEQGEVKLVVLFEQEGHCAVLSLDRISEDDISIRSHPQGSGLLEDLLRVLLEE